MQPRTNSDAVKEAHYRMLTGENKDFICNALRFDGEVLYSYGRHYPLLRKKNGKFICNDVGYSTTTRKHIGYARSYADIFVELYGGDMSDENVLKSFDNTIERLQKELDNCVREVSKKKTRLIEQIKRVKQNKQEYIDTIYS